MNVIWNLDQTTCVPLNKISYFRVVGKQEAAGMTFYVYAFFPGNEGNFRVFVANNKQRCIDYLNAL